MKLFTKVGRVDVSPLVAQLDAHPELWDSYDYRKNAKDSPHNEMSDIWIRYRPVEELVERHHFKEPHIPIWWPAASVLTRVKPLALALMGLVKGEMLCGIFITKIPPGKGIAKHTDDGWHVSYTSKYYVSLRSAPGADFCSGDERLNPKPGEIWKFDNKLEHWVENNSDKNRITLIICIH